VEILTSRSIGETATGDHEIDYCGNPPTGEIGIV
jgi:hypothetical protein